jgi:hypothetical protein
MIHNLATIGLVLAFLQALAFVIRYLMTDWYRHSMGRHAMAFMVALALVLSIGIVREFVPEWIDLDTARLVTYILINTVFAWRLWLLFTGQRRNRKTGPDDNHVS